MKDDKNTCPWCGATVIHDGGCIQCPDPACGWNKPMHLAISTVFFVSSIVLRKAQMVDSRLDHR